MEKVVLTVCNPAEIHWMSQCDDRQINKSGSHTTHSLYLTTFIMSHEDNHSTEKKAEKERELEK